MKTCLKCGEEKPLDSFYKHPQMLDGHLNKCKECAKKDIISNRLEKIDYYKKYEQSRASLPHRVEARRLYAGTLNGREALNRGKRSWISRNLEKRKAQSIVACAIRDKELVRLPCEVCGATERIHAHHNDYSDPLDVRWLCAKHHSELHKKLRYNNQ
ncbi:MAG: hypothetical protein BA874_03740 [Desulfuromonadales bacterium C00003068]|jgi:hypothetical protein|nr:MAG: hypothetical protein BA874_03740 [Desulfuromonadales bacterium C00003068]